jgi:hypothetical protein
MPKITIKESSGNAPKKLKLRDLNIAFIKGDIESLLGLMTDDIEWTMIGNKVVKGREEVRKFMSGMLEIKGTELIINNIIVHGRYGAADGSMKFEDGSTIAFCDVYTFNKSDSSAKIKKMTSYGVELKKE